MTTHLSHLGISAPMSAGELLSDMRFASGSETRTHRFRTGMRPLDDVLGGGFRPQELVLLGGRPGAGKTITALQWARSCALGDATAIYVCYEHAPATLIGRLFAMELAIAGRGEHAHAIDGLVGRVYDTIVGGAPLDPLLIDPAVRHAYESIQTYASRLHFVAASGRGTDIESIDTMLSRVEHGPVALFVDYLQKMPVRDEQTSDAAVDAHRAERLKDLAIEHNAGVVAVVAGDRDALRERRMRLHHMRGASSLAYEADTIILMNDKAVAVSRSHLAFDSTRAEQFRTQVVFSVEKHRGGPSTHDIEFTKDFAHYRFHPDGAFLAEKLVDDVLYID